MKNSSGQSRRAHGLAGRPPFGGRAPLLFLARGPVALECRARSHCPLRDRVVQPSLADPCGRRCKHARCPANLGRLCASHVKAVVCPRSQSGGKVGPSIRPSRLGDVTGFLPVISQRFSECELRAAGHVWRVNLDPASSPDAQNKKADRQKKSSDRTIFSIRGDAGQAERPRCRCRPTRTVVGILIREA